MECVVKNCSCRSLVNIMSNETFSQLLNKLWVDENIKHIEWTDKPSVAIFGKLSWIWLLLTLFGKQNFLFGNLSFLATCPFWLLIWLLLKIWLETGFKSVLNRFWLYLFEIWCRYFCLLKDIWCRYFGFSLGLWVVSTSAFLVFFLAFSYRWVYFQSDIPIVPPPCGITS